MDVQDEFIDLKDLVSFYRGRTAEQVVGQNIIAQSTDNIPNILYWARGKPQGAAEVDFCLQNGSDVLGIEVKSGRAGRLRSLVSFADKVKNHKLIRIYGGPLKREKVKMKDGSSDLVSVPFYLTPRILDM
jgi:hypothetical protein